MQNALFAALGLTPAPTYPLPLNKLGRPKAKHALLALAALIVGGGFVLALFAGVPTGTGNLTAAQAGGYSSFVGAVNEVPGAISGLTSSFGVNHQGSQVSYGGTQVVGGGTAYTVTMSTTTTVGTTPQTSTQGTTTNSTAGLSSGSGGSIEFSSQLTLVASSAQQTASSVVALAYSVGGYVAYQSTYATTANVVVRVPASQYQGVLAQIEGLGTVQELTSNSNDVTVQYTDLNATLASLQTEQQALLRLLNQSSSVNSTLAIESQLQGVNQQINEVQSQILQTKTLISFATINVTINEKAHATPLSLSLSATPENGTAPLSVTFNAVVKGGAPPYFVNYNFGDGFAAQGQIVIHTYTGAGTYSVAVSATDQNGTVVQGAATIHVSPPKGGSGAAKFLGSVGALFIGVVEGIVEVAVVVLPVAAVGAAVVVPIQRYSKGKKQVRQEE